MEKQKKNPKKATESKTSVRSYQRGINNEKNKMGAYSKNFRTNVRSLQDSFKKHAKDMKNAALNLREEGIRNMNKKVKEFKAKIQDQITENKTAVSHIENGVNLFIGECNKKKRDFRAYARGPFTDYIKAFWGTE